MVINGSVAAVLPGHYGKVSMDDMQLVGAPVYRLSMIAEAYATKGTNSFILYLHLRVMAVSLCHSCSDAVCPHGGSTAPLQLQSGIFGLFTKKDADIYNPDVPDDLFFMQQNQSRS